MHNKETLQRMLQYLLKMSSSFREENYMWRIIRRHFLSVRVHNPCRICQLRPNIATKQGQLWWKPRHRPVLPGCRLCWYDNEGLSWGRSPAPLLLITGCLGIPAGVQGNTSKYATHARVSVQWKCSIGIEGCIMKLWKSILLFLLEHHMFNLSQITTGGGGGGVKGESW